MSKPSKTPEDRPALEGKRPYATPTLKQFGSISQLTSGSGGTRTDGVMVDKR